MGYFRFSMMLAVMYYHIAHQAISAYLAVFGLFALSGYVNTLVTAEYYCRGWQGAKLFLLNRFYRIYPTYMVCLAVSLLCMWATGFTTQQMHRYYRLPVNIEDWIYQFTIIGLSNMTPDRCPERLLPAAWSLSTELVYYILIGLVTGTSRKLTVVAFCISVVLAVWMSLNEMTFKYFYLTIYGPAFSFYLGALVYHYREEVNRFSASYPIWVLIVVLNLLLYIPDFLVWPYKHPYMPLYFFATFGLAWLIQCVKIAEEMTPAFKRWESWCASLTYPAFLLHWPIGAIASYTIYGEYQHTFTLFCITLVLTLATSMLLVRFVEKPLKPVRARNRQKALALQKEA